MITPAVLLTVAAAILLFGAVSRRLATGPITPPMVFVAVGIAAGSAGLGVIPTAPDPELLRLLGELTLVVVLFTDASRIHLRLLLRQQNLPLRLLGFGLPLTIAAGWAAAWLILPGVDLWTAAVIAAVLAPTDAALGQAVVSLPVIPVRIRQTLNVESGLNDGLVLPAVVIVLSCLGAEGHTGSAGDWAYFAVLQVTLGPLVGLAAGAAGARLVTWGRASGWMTHSFQDLAGVALALAAFSAAELVGGNGFIAAFFAGLAIGTLAREACGPLYEFAEAEGQLMTLIVFLIFGASLVPRALAAATPADWIYALLSLTVIRMAPVVLALAGSGLRLSSVLFLGWFGPRGIASILFLVLVVEEMVPGAASISSVVVLTVFLSVLLHGSTAAPAARRYGAAMALEETGEETRQVEEMPLRLGSSVRKA